MNQHEDWTINAPIAVSEIIDGELVVINLEKGSYYSGTGIGSYVWSCLELRAPRAAIERAVVEGFALPVEQVATEVGGFLAMLASEGLVRPAAAGDVDAGVSLAPPIGDYAPPELQVYSDMQDLLLLDPIHDVGDDGWPTTPRAPAA